MNILSRIRDIRPRVKYMMSRIRDNRPMSDKLTSPKTPGSPQQQLFQNTFKMSLTRQLLQKDM